MAKNDDYCSPDVRPEMPGSPAMGLMNQALDRQAAHDEWHECNPGQMCSPADFPMTDYADIQRGREVMDLAGGGTIEAGDSFVFGK